MLPTQAPHPNAAPDTSNLHDLAVGAEKNIEQLATGLGQVGAAPEAVKAVTQMADVLRKIATGLAKGMQHEPPPQQGHTMASATDAMMADHAAQMQAGPPAGP